MTMRRPALGTLLCCLALAACTPFGRPEPLHIVAPMPAITLDPAWSQVDWSLLVQRPIADQTRGSVRIVVRSANARLSYYPGIAWLDELPEMLQTELLRAFTDSGRIPAVARPGVARARFALATEIRRFDAVQDGAKDDAGRLAVELELQAALLEVRTGELLASRVFRQRVPAAGRDADTLTVAFESALGALTSELIGWTLKAGSSATAAQPADG